MVLHRGPKLAEFGVYRNVELNDLLMPTLTEEEAHAYDDLVKLDILKVPLSDSGNMDWLFALRGSGNIILLLILKFFSFFCLIFLSLLRPYIYVVSDLRFSYSLLL